MLKPLGKLSKTVVVMIGITIIIEALNALLLAVGLVALALVPAGQNPSDLLLLGLSTPDLIISLASLGLAYALLIAYLMWVYRLSQHLHARSGTFMEYTPGWAVGWYFVPIASLIIPFRVMAEMWSALHKGNPPGKAFIIRWWVLRIASGVLSQVALQISVRGLTAVSDLPTFTIWFLLADLVSIGADIYYLQLAKRFAEAYETNYGDERLAELLPALQGPAPAYQPYIPGATSAALGTASEWHIIIDGASVGPIADAEVRAWARSGRLAPKQLVWRAGIPNWIAARDAGLFTDTWVAFAPDEA